MARNYATAHRAVLLSKIPLLKIGRITLLRDVCIKFDKKYGYIATISIHTTKMAHMPFKPQQKTW